MRIICQYASKTQSALKHTRYTVNLVNSEGISTEIFFSIKCLPSGLRASLIFDYFTTYLCSSLCSGGSVGRQENSLKFLSLTVIS